jgi:hypothetical protein
MKGAKSSMRVAQSFHQGNCAVQTQVHCLDFIAAPGQEFERFRVVHSRRLLILGALPRISKIWIIVEINSSGQCRAAIAKMSEFFTAAVRSGFFGLSPFVSFTVWQHRCMGGSELVVPIYRDADKASRLDPPRTSSLQIE